jgi:hypothetical protein
MKKSLAFTFLFSVALVPSIGQILTTPTGTVGNNGTSDQVKVNGTTVLVNPAGRTLLLERDDNDSWLTFHDPNNSWFTMGIDQSNGGMFTLNAGPTPDYLTQFTMNVNGNVGIMNNNPQQALDVAGIIAVRGRKVINTSGSTDGSDIYINSRVIRNESNGLADGMYINYDATGGAAAHLRFYANGQTERMRIDAATGNVGIGTQSPDAKLAVKGTVHSQAVVVDLNGGIAPDYVFETGYNLPSLETVKSYIGKHHHLPEVPSAKQMESKGINVAEMNLLLLKKVEELTVYLINQEEPNKAQQEMIDALKKEVTTLKDHLK